MHPALSKCWRRNPVGKRKSVLTEKTAFDFVLEAVEARAVKDFGVVLTVEPLGPDGGTDHTVAGVRLRLRKDFPVCRTCLSVPIPVALAVVVLVEVED